MTSRGVRRTALFRSDADRHRFLELLAVTVKELCWQSLAWCLMTNHYHVLVLTPEPDLAVGMHRLNGAYARHFNREHGESGHVFERRYHCEHILRDSHLLEAIRYIARNPVRAGLCSCPSGWRWSSHRAAVGLDDPLAVDVAALHARFAAYGGEGPSRYAEFVGGGLRQVAVRTASPDEAVRPPLAEILNGRHDMDAIRGAADEYRYGVREIARALDCHPSTVSRRLHRHRNSA